MNKQKNAQVLLDSLNALSDNDKIAVALVLRRIYRHSVAMAPFDGSRCNWHTEQICLLNEEWEAIEKVVC